MRKAAIAFVFALLASPVLAEPAPAPDQPLPSAAQEARAQALFQDIRCVVCQHESIADSPAGIAADMRRLVREEIASGATDESIREDLGNSYTVTYYPQANPNEGFRKINVELLTDKDKKFKVQARPGYRPRSGF